jgi:hypothetical protein
MRKSRLITIKIVLAIIITGAHCQSATSQKVLLNSILETTNDISARENELRDANGYASAIVKARLGLKDVEFLTDRGINKIEERAGEFWLWIPPGTQEIKIIRHNTDTLEVKLPETVKEYDVWVVLFTVVLSAETEIVDLPKLTFSTKPSQADAYINNIYQGRTPLAIGLIPGEFTYRVEKSGFEFLEGSDILPDTGKELSLKLRSKRRFFFQINSDMFLPNNFNGGFTVGMIGQTGFYLSYLFPLKTTTPGVVINSKYNSVYHEEFWLGEPEEEKLVVDFNFFALGITQTVFKQVVAKAGVVYGDVELLQRFNATPYTSSEPHFDIMVLRKDKSLNNSFGMNMGLTYRIREKLLFSADYYNFFGKKTLVDDYGNPVVSVGSSIISNLSIGIGYSF